MHPRFELGPEVNDAAMERFAVGVGFHGLVDGLRYRPKRTDPLTAVKLSEIAKSAPDIVSGLIAAGELIDPVSAFSGATPTWAL